MIGMKLCMKQQKDMSNKKWKKILPFFYYTYLIIETAIPKASGPV